MTKIYVAAPGRTIPTGWPEDGRPINELSPYERRLVLDKDLIVAKAAAAKKKDISDGQ